MWRHIKWLSGAVGLCLAFPVIADWGVDGAAIYCAPGGKGFVVAATVELSDESDAGVVWPGDEFTQLTDGENDVRCTVAQSVVSASIKVHPPAARGMCMGGGYVWIERFTAGGVSIFSSPQEFNWSCSQPRLIRVVITPDIASLKVETCHAKDWAWGVGFSGVTCQIHDPKRFRASFDCTKAATNVEHIICASDELSRLDHLMYAAYSEAIRFQRPESALRRDQRQWIKGIRDVCSNEPCLRSAYEKRIAELGKLNPTNDPTKRLYRDVQ